VNSVALQGVAIGSRSSADRLLNYTKNILLALDSDKAGFTAMEKINRMFNQKGIVPKLVTFLPHKDADEFLLAEGKIALQEKSTMLVPPLIFIYQNSFLRKFQKSLTANLKFFTRLLTWFPLCATS